MLRRTKRDFDYSVFEDNKNDARAIWKTIKTLSGSTKNTQEVSKLKVDDRIVEDKEQMADEFNFHFSTVADRIRVTLSQISFDVSKLVNFVTSKKQPDVLFTIPDNKYSSYRYFKEY